MQKPVDGGVPVVGVGLLPGLDEPDQLPVGLHSEGHGAVLGVDQLPWDPVEVEAAPPAGDLGVGEDLGQRAASSGVIGRRRTARPRSVAAWA
jgi:hypothetical protein